MRIDDKVRTTYLQREAIKMANGIFPSSEVTAQLKKLMDNTQKLEKKFYDYCVGVRGKF